MTPRHGSPGAVDPLAQLLAAPPDLPVAAGLDRLAAALAEDGTAVLQAPPGSGKTTLVPPAVAVGLGASARRVVLTQPRRIAARAAARRLASLLGEPVGHSVGYAVRGERRTSAATRIEVVTTGLLVRRLQHAPDLPGVGAVVLDEVHERSLDADLALALLVDVRPALREDLQLVAMSATVEAERFARLLGGSAPAPVIEVPGALHPVAVQWRPAPSGVHWLDERGVTRGYLDHVAATVRRALAHPGDVLVFLPGAREVDGVARRLVELVRDGVAVHRLHGRLPAAEQDAALRASEPGRRHERRVVVSTAVAESSLTVPGVRVVVDAGLSREPRTDHRRGLAGLVTVRVSRAAAEQRAGRAGREGPGVVLRCYSESEHAHLPAHPRPEIAVADLSGLALELAAWGVHDAAGRAALALPDQPPAAALAAAHQALSDLGALDDDGVLTPRGRAMAEVPAEPRLARALLDGAALVGRRRAAEVVALLADDVRAPGGDLPAALRAARRGEVPGWRVSAERLRAAVPDGARGPGSGSGPEELTDDLAVGAVVALAHPDRIARRRDPSAQAASYLMVGGTGAELTGESASLADVAWLAVADVERRPGRRDASVRSAAPLTEDLALEAAASRWHESEEVSWERGRAIGRRVTRLGAIELGSVPVSDPDPDAVRRAVADGLRHDGLGVLHWSDAATGLRRRLTFLHRSLGEPWPDVSDEALLAGLDGRLDGRLDGWLGDLGSIRDPRRADVLAGLRGLLPWPEAARLDELAPERLPVPSGRTVRVDYEPDQPVLAVKLQELFGLTASPVLAGGRVPVLLHLLSPAGRPLAVTADLASFWRHGYPAVRGEMRGRYPRHPWPEDPWTAPATGRAQPRG